jgi:methyl-accepting chemotaxis protein
MKDNYPDEAKEKTSKQEEMVAESSALYAAPEMPAAPDELSARNYFEKFLEQRFVAIEIKINSLKELFQHTIVQVDRRFEQVDKRFEQVDKRFEEINKKFEEINDRFEKVDQRINEMDKHLNQRIDNLSIKIDGQYKWVIGLIAATFLTLVGTIIFR